jgi:hypothetical protein
VYLQSQQYALLGVGMKESKYKAMYLLPDEWKELYTPQEAKRAEQIYKFSKPNQGWQQGVWIEPDKEDFSND